MNNFSNTTKNKVLVAGTHSKIIQSILDFDFASGADVPNVSAIVGGANKSHKCWFGDNEILLPVYASIKKAYEAGVQANWLLNITSANSAKKVTELFFECYPDATGAHLFCEGLSEQDALSLVERFGSTKLIAGASGVGLMIPGSLKLGAIGGVFGGNINLLSKQTGNTAVICSSGGMANELIDVLLRSGGCPSFAVSFGGDRFPVTSPVDWCLVAESDERTNQIVFFGELGGLDEYDIAEAVKSGKIKKPIYAYIAGHYESGEEKIQFGHAKALAKTPHEDAKSKIKALSESGVTAVGSYSEYVDLINDLPHSVSQLESARQWTAPETFRTNSLFTAVKDRGLGIDNFVTHALCTLLEKESVSGELVEFTELAYSLLIDHGAEPSGAVNTMITARAGRDMGASIASGILTVGDRFGGAINEAASTWFDSVRNDVSINELLESKKSAGKYVMGIGHKKYTVHNNDPRVISLIDFAKNNLTRLDHLNFAVALAETTTQKKTSLILNIDGVIGAVLLDILVEKENLTEEQIMELIDIEFFNSYFLIPRTVGFIGNYLSQKRRDEGLFRLPENQVFYE